jgi:hypothetical protein
MDNNYTVQANFAITPVALTFTIVGEPNGVISQPPGPFYIGDVVMLEAIPNPGYRIRAWTGTDNDSSLDETNTVTLHSEQTSVTVEFASIITTTKCILKGGITADTDSFSLKGTLSARPEDFNNAQTVILNIGPYEEIIETVKFQQSSNRPRFTYKGESGGITLIKFYLDTDFFRIRAKKVDLTGLESPVKVGISFGDYAGWDNPDEDIINGRRPVPMLFMSSYANKLRVDKASVNDSQRLQSDSLVVKGALAVFNEDIDLTNEQLTVSWANQTFVFPVGSFIQKGTLKKYVCSRRYLSDGSLVRGSIDLTRTKFKIIIKKVNIESMSGIIPFRLKFGEFDESVSIIVP